MPKDWRLRALELIFIGHKGLGLGGGEKQEGVQVSGSSYA